MRVSQALDCYAVQLEADGRSPHTIQQARRHVRLFVETMGDRRVEEVRPEDVAKFLASGAVAKTASGDARRPSSANALRSSLRCFFAFAHASGYSNVNAARLVRRARCGPSRPRALPDDDAAKLSRRLAEAHEELGKRDRAMIETMLRAGLRVGSLVALDVEDFVGDELHLRRLKGGGSDVVYLPDALATLLRDHVGERVSGPMFVGPNGRRLTTRHVARRLAHWAERAGIGATRPHALRHAFATAIYARSRDVLLTARALCHRSVASTATYARPSDGDLRRVVAM